MGASAHWLKCSDLNHLIDVSGTTNITNNLHRQHLYTDITAIVAPVFSYSKIDSIQGLFTLKYWY